MSPSRSPIAPHTLRRRRCTTGLVWGVATVAVVLAAAAPDAWALRRRVVHESAGRFTFASPQSNPVALTSDGSLVFVAATTSNRVDVVDTATNQVIGHATVGIDPVSVAVRPGDTELWVSNHVSDSVSVVDIDPASPTFLDVVETVQDVDSNGVTQFDEPVGIAFKEDGSQAYVALSSRNDVALVDTTTYQVTGRLHVTAQDPRAIAVRGGRLFVAAFESGNQTELSSCESLSDDPDCTLDAADLLTFATDPNLPGLIKNIEVDTDANVPDRDLFVWNIGSGLADGDPPDDTVSGVGTLLYGLAVSPTGGVFVTQAEARNAANGVTLGPGNGGAGDVNGDTFVNLADLQNRMFLNQITEVDCSGGAANPCGTVTRHDLEPAPGNAVALPLATPYGVALDSDAELAVATAAASSRLFSWDVQNGSGPGKVLASLDVGSIPRGVALDSAAGRAYVLNTLGNTLSVVSVDVDGTSPTFGALALVTDVPVGADPTPDAVRLGRIAFNDANASTSGTFACASCHPDGNTDQLLWRIGGSCPALGGTAKCDADEDEPRTTMPIRGLRDSIPLHWTGNLGDPFGGPNGDTGSAGSLAPNCTDDHSCFVQLADAALGGVMCDQGGACPAGGNELSAQERDDMASFLEVVSYPPARSRPDHDVVTAQAVLGFQDFFFDQGGAVTQPDTCADSDAGCHELPLGTSTNSETLEGFDAPTMRGLTDRFIQFSIAPTGSSEVLQGSNDGACVLPPLLCSPANPFPYSAAAGMQESTTFGAAFAIFNPVYNVGPVNIFEMFEEASTGFSGAFGRQVTLNPATVAGTPSSPADAVLDVLEQADERGLVNLRGRGRLNGHPIEISYLQATQEYLVSAGKKTRATMMSDVLNGTLTATLTAMPRGGASEASAQPLLAPLNAQCGAGTGSTGDPAIPGGSNVTVAAAHVAAGDAVFLNGQPTGITVQGSDLTPGGGSSCSSSAGIVTPDGLTINGLVRTGATDLLQVRSTGSGLLSNELPLP